MACGSHSGAGAPSGQGLGWLECRPTHQGVSGSFPGQGRAWVACSIPVGHVQEAADASLSLTGVPPPKLSSSVSKINKPRPRVRTGRKGTPSEALLPEPGGWRISTGRILLHFRSYRRCSCVGRRSPAVEKLVPKPQLTKNIFPKDHCGSPASYFVFVCTHDVKGRRNRLFESLLSGSGDETCLPVMETKWGFSQRPDGC